MKALKIQVRTKKEDSARLYHILEAHEGLTAYCTLEHRRGEQHRDVELIFAPESHADVLALIEDLKTHIEIEILSKT